MHRYSIPLCVLFLIGCGSEEKPEPNAKPFAKAATKPKAKPAAKPTAKPTAATEPAKPEPKKPAAGEPNQGGIVDQLQGKWVISEAAMGGAPIDAMKGSVAEITGNSIVVNAGGVEMKSTMTFDADSDPIRFESVNAQGGSAKAILKLDGETLTVCTALLPDADYPTSFEGGQGLMVITYTRAK